MRIRSRLLPSRKVFEGFNIVGGESPPTDTSKLWLQGATPEDIDKLNAAVLNQETDEPENFKFFDFVDNVNRDIKLAYDYSSDKLVTFNKTTMNFEEITALDPNTEYNDVYHAPKYYYVTKNGTTYYAATITDTGEITSSELNEYAGYDGIIYPVIYTYTGTFNNKPMLVLDSSSYIFGADGAGVYENSEHFDEDLQPSDPLPAMNFKLGSNYAFKTVLPAPNKLQCISGSSIESVDGVIEYGPLMCVYMPTYNSTSVTTTCIFIAVPNDKNLRINVDITINGNNSSTPYTMEEMNPVYTWFRSNDDAKQVGKSCWSYVRGTQIRWFDGQQIHRYAWDDTASDEVLLLPGDPTYPTVPIYGHNGTIINGVPGFLWSRLLDDPDGINQGPTWGLSTGASQNKLFQYVPELGGWYNTETHVKYEP